jgi:hypothetical protein
MYSEIPFRCREILRRRYIRAGLVAGAIHGRCYLPSRAETF